jgi:hypothetical protein
MKKLILFLTVVLLHASCHKNDKTYPTYFYVNADQDEGVYSLYINKVYKGDLPYFKLKMDEITDSIKAKCLFLNLKEGTYKIEARDATGAPKVQSTMKFKISSRRTSVESSGGMGGTGVLFKNDQFVIALSY